MHPLTWACKWFNCKAKFTYHPRAGEAPDQELHAEEPVCLLLWMDKKYRSEDKKVVFITNCIPAIPETPQKMCWTIEQVNQWYSPVTTVPVRMIIIHFVCILNVT